jgi:transmembrane sensor
MIDPRTRQRHLKDQAVAWLVRLQSDEATDADRAGFAAWYASSDAHRKAYSEAEIFVCKLRRPALEVWDDQLFKKPSGPRTWTMWWVPAVAACAALLSLVFLWHAYNLTSSDIHRTAKGEHRRFQLEDGSSVLLNSNTTIRVTFTGQRRGIELEAGEAFFVVAKDPQRPFEVRAGLGTTRAVGTEFNVRLRESTATVTVVEGVVRVSQPPRSGEGSSAESSIEVSENEAVTYSGTEGMGTLRRSDPVTSLAWQRGQMVFNKKPLVEVIDELNQQWDRRVVVAGPRLRQLPVNGVFDIHDPDAVVRAVERTFQVRSLSLPLNILVLF